MVATEQRPETDLSIEGMTCASCVRRVERALLKVPGVEGAGVNLATEQAVVRGDAPLPALLAAVERAGYHAAPVEEEATPLDVVDRQRAAARSRLADIAVGAVFTIPVVILSVFFADRFAAENWLLLVLTLPVWLWAGRSFHLGALRDRKSTRLNSSHVAISYAVFC